MKIKNGFGKIVISLIVSVSIFVALLMIEKNVLSPNGTVKVIKATDNIEKGTVLTEESINKLFTEVEVDGALKLENGVQEKENIINKILLKDIEKGEIISNKSLLDKKSVLVNIIEPIEVSFKVQDIAQVVGGTLREGDIIDISIVSELTKENEKILQNIYVNKALTSDGKEIKKSDKTATSIVNVIISKADEAIFNKSLELGTLRISRAK